MNANLIAHIGRGVATFVIFVYDQKPELVLWCHTNEDCHERLDTLVEEVLSTGYIQDWPESITMASILIKDEDTIELIDDVYRWEQGDVWVTSYILPPGIKTINELSPSEAFEVPIADVKHDGFAFVDTTEDDRIGVEMYIRHNWPTWRKLKGVL